MTHEDRPKRPWHEHHTVWRASKDRRSGYRVAVVNGPIEDAQSMADALPDDEWDTIIDPPLPDNLAGWWDEDPWWTHTPGTPDPFRV